MLQLHQPQPVYQNLSENVSARLDSVINLKILLPSLHVSLALLTHPPVLSQLPEF